MIDNNLDCCTSAMPSACGAYKALTIDEIKQALDLIPPPPSDQDFIFSDGMVHARYRRGKLRVSSKCLALLKSQSVCDSNIYGFVGAGSGVAVELDINLPCLAYQNRREAK